MQQLQQEWAYIPDEAFLFFPTGEQIKSGSEDKTLRRIFENGQPYDSYENERLQKLQKHLNKEKVQPHKWFTKANKLRYLQANAFNISKTIDSIVESSKWRDSDFPLVFTSEIKKILNRGVVYICGRDLQYRPNVVVNIQKFQDGSKQQHLKGVLMVILQFIINQLLIEGQVQNYNLIVDVSTFTMATISLIKNIVSFTSNTYRSRLYVCYLLGAPFILRACWNGIASKLVSDSTKNKIKITDMMSHDNMWKHMCRETVEQKFGGKLPNIIQGYWPPNRQLLTRTLYRQEKIISREEYFKLYEAGHLADRKVNKKLFPGKDTKDSSTKDEFVNPLIRDQNISNGKTNQKRDSKMDAQNQHRKESIMRSQQKKPSKLQIKKVNHNFNSLEGIFILNEDVQPSKFQPRRINHLFRKPGYLKIK